MRKQFEDEFPDIPFHTKISDEKHSMNWSEESDYLKKYLKGIKKQLTLYSQQNYSPSKISRIELEIYRVKNRIHTLNA
jgi:hypothetical protein